MKSRSPVSGCIKGPGSVRAAKLFPEYEFYVQVKVEIWVNEIQLHDNSQLMYSQTNKTTILHVCGNFTWRAKIQNDDYPLIAQHFKLIQHSKQNMFVDNVFAGTILAPSSNVILGQSNKIFYGSVIANDITVHQYSRIYHIPFLNEKSTIYIMAGLK